MSEEISRRTFVTGSLLSTAGIAIAGASSAADSPQRPARPPTPGRSAPGQNREARNQPPDSRRQPVDAFHAQPRLALRLYLTARYNTDEKILETLALAEAQGINTVSMHNPPHPMSLLRRYRKERGGKIQWIICPTAAVEPGLAEYRQHVEDLIKDGCDAIYLWGVHADPLVAQGKIDLVAEAVELPKKYGVPSGVGCHALDVVKACEQHGVKADFYIKTFHNHSYPTAPKPEQITGPLNEFPGYWCSNPKETADFMKGVQKPWIAFKTMAAGAIPPRQAFRRAFASGADFVLAGMFDFEIAEDVQIALDAVAAHRDRERPWRA